MTIDPNSLIWATRGRSWGFRFLRTGGLSDPLRTYEDAFAGVGNEREYYRRVGQKVALRFQDPEGRTDAAGRVIPHDFVLMPSASQDVNSLDDGIAMVWSAVADEFARVWDSRTPPASR